MLLRLAPDGSMEFPHPIVYPQQLEMILELRTHLAKGERVLLDLPAGRQLALMSYLVQARPPRRVIWVSPTRPAMLETLELLQQIYQTCPSVRTSLFAVPVVESHACPLGRCHFNADHPCLADKTSGVVSLDELKILGTACQCETMTARFLAARASVVVLPTHRALLDPKACDGVNVDESIVVFDEGANLDQTCLEAMSLYLTLPLVESAAGELAELQRALEQTRKQDPGRLREEYLHVCGGVGVAPGQPLLAGDVLDPLLPGNLRRPEHLIKMLEELLGHLKLKLEGETAQAETLTRFQFELERTTRLEAPHLKYVHARLHSLLGLLGLQHSLPRLVLVGQFISEACYYQGPGFRLVFEPFDLSCATKFRSPCLQLACLDARKVFKAQTARAHAVCVADSGLVGADVLAKVLGATVTLPCRLEKRIGLPMWPVVCSRAADQMVLSSAASQLSALHKYYATLLSDVCAKVPDGVLAFFPNNLALEKAVESWYETRALDAVMGHKLVFCETLDAKETSLVLDEYCNACDVGRGALLLAHYRGRVAEHVRLAGHRARCVVILGYPDEIKRFGVGKARSEFLRTELEVAFADSVAYEACKAVWRLLGKGLRCSNDWRAMILVDAQFARPVFKSKLPGWVRQVMQEEDDVSQDVLARQLGVFMRGASWAAAFDKISQDEVGEWVEARERDKRRRMEEEMREAARQW